MSSFSQMASNPNYLEEERARSRRTPSPYSSMALQSCPACKKRRSVRQFATLGGVCAKCRGAR